MNAREQLAATPQLEPPADAARRPMWWMDSANCASVWNGFFYPAEGGRGASDAKRVCAACPVRDACLAWALDTRQLWGVWGGTTERQRRKMIRDRDGEADRALGITVARPA